MPNKTTTKAVLLSGGVDSTTLLAILKRDELPEEPIVALSFLYGQRHSKELDAAAAIATHFDVAHLTIDIKGVIGKGGLTDSNMDIPDKSYAELGEGVSPTYVPFRNGALLSIACSQAHGIAMSLSQDGARANDGKFVVCYGAHLDDAAGGAYPDCTREFVDAMREVIQIGTYNKGNLYAPFVTRGFNKERIVKLGSELEVPWELTWSCYRGENLHCGTCPTCQDRRAAFKAAGVADPTEYAA